MPARVAARLVAAPVALDAVSGTVLTGRIMLDGAHLIEWRARPGPSLASLALVADWHLSGPQTDVSGRAVIRPGAIGLEDVNGQAGWPLLRAVLPDLAIACDGQARIDAVSVALSAGARHAVGRVTSAPARCAPTDGSHPPIDAPALTADLSDDAGGIALRVFATDRPGTELAQVIVTPQDRVQITLRQAGAAMVPGLPAGADSTVDLPLGALLP